MLLIIIYVPHYKHICPILTFGLGDIIFIHTNNNLFRPLVLLKKNLATIKNHLEYQSSNNIHL